MAARRTLDEARSTQLSEHEPVDAQGDLRLGRREEVVFPELGVFGVPGALFVEEGGDRRLRRWKA